jgi:hypothetical protein
MTRDSELVGLLEDYLDDVEGHTYLPDTTRDAIRARLPLTSQRPAWWPGWRSPEMNTMMKYGLGAVAAVLVAVVGIQLFAPGGGIGAPTATPSSAIPTAEASLEASTIVIGEGVLSHARVSTLRPAGWSFESNFAGKETGPNGIGFSAWTNVGVHQDPCRWDDEAIDYSGNPTVEEIVAALVAQPGRDPSTPTRTSLGGWPAMRVELRVPSTLDISTCDRGRYKAWTDLSDPNGGNWNHESGQFDVIYVVDVDGGPVVVDDWYHASTTRTDLGELEAVLESMVIDVQD